MSTQFREPPQIHSQTGLSCDYINALSPLYFYLDLLNENRGERFAELFGEELKDIVILDYEKYLENKSFKHSQNSEEQIDRIEALDYQVDLIRKLTKSNSIEIAIYRRVLENIDCLVRGKC